MNTKQTALDAYLTSNAAIHAELERLQQLADDHFGHDPDAIHWGHVGDLGRVETGLDELLAIFGGDGVWRRPATIGDDHERQTDRHPNHRPQSCRRPSGWQLEPLPSNLRGGARTAVIDGLLSRDLITKFQYPDHAEYYLTDAAYAAVGRKRKVPAPVTPDAETEDAVSAAEANWAQERTDTKPRARENSKQVAVIQMLQRPDGTTIRQIMESTGWQAHTVRGTFARALKKKLGLNIVSAKDATGERVYRIA